MKTYLSIPEKYVLNVCTSLFLIFVSQYSIAQTASTITVLNCSDSINLTASDASCYGLNDGTANIVVNGGNAPYSYQWNSGHITGNVNDFTSGQYTCTITDNVGCQDNVTLTIGEPAEIISTLSSTTYSSGSNVSCNGASNGDIDLTISGGASSFSVNWTTINGNGIVANAEDQSGLSGGTYQVQITDITGCSVTDFITLSEPLPLSVIMTPQTHPNGDNIRCSGSQDGVINTTTIGGSGPFTYDWSTIDGFGLTQGSENQTFLKVGTYDLTVTDVNGCMTSNQLALTEPDPLQTQINGITNYNGSVVSCVGMDDGIIGSITNGGAPGYSLEWNTSTGVTLSADTLTDIGEGTYSVTVTDLNGCIANNTLIVTANPLPIMEPDPAFHVCEGDLVTFGSAHHPNESAIWQLSNGMSFDFAGPHPVILDTGSYDAVLIETTDFGCTDTMVLDNYIVVNKTPVADFNFVDREYTVNNNQVLFINNSPSGSSAEWSFGDGNSEISWDGLNNYPSDEPGEYDVTLTIYDEIGCANSQTQQVTIKDDLTFYVPNAFTPDGNEVNQVFYPVFGSGVSPSGYQFMVYNRWGELMYQTNDLSSGWDGTINNGQMAPTGDYAWKMVLVANEKTLEPNKIEIFQGSVALMR